jgi:AraC family transcriptional regulator
MSSDAHAMTALVKALDFIEGSLQEAIGISDVADAASYSLYHFCRLFNRYVHHTPYDYLMRRRLAEAARELKQTDKQIVDIAFEYQFNSHETFCRAFKRFTGMQPKEWRKKGIEDRRFAFSRRTKQHLQFIHGGLLAKTEVIEHRALILAGVSTIIKPGADSVRPLWRLLEKEAPFINNAVQPISLYSVKTYPDNWEQDGIIYMAAVEVKKLDEVNPCLTVKPLSAGTTYAVFSISGPYQPAMDYIYQTWLAKSGRRPAYPLEIECMGTDWSHTSAEDLVRKVLIPIT